VKVNLACANHKDGHDVVAVESTTPGLVVHRPMRCPAKHAVDTGEWVITHKRSGLCVARFWEGRRKDVLAIAADLAECTDWTAAAKDVLKDAPKILPALTRAGVINPRPITTDYGTRLL